MAKNRSRALFWLLSWDLNAPGQRVCPKSGRAGFAPWSGPEWAACARGGRKVCGMDPVVLPPADNSPEGTGSAAWDRVTRMLRPLGLGLCKREAWYRAQWRVPPKLTCGIGLLLGSMHWADALCRNSIFLTLEEEGRLHHWAGSLALCSWGSGPGTGVLPEPSWVSPYSLFLPR